MLKKNAVERYCELVFLINTEKCSNHQFLLLQLENYRDGRNLTPKQLRGPTDMEGHAQKCVGEGL